MRRETLPVLQLTLVAAVLIAALAGPVASYGTPTGMGEQEVMQPDLRQELSRLTEGEFLRIIIRLRDQLPAKERRAILAKAKEKAERKKTLTNALRIFAKRSQRPLLAQLKKLQAEKLVKNIRPLWLTNVIAVEARREAIEEIVKFESIEYVKQDIKRPVFQQTPAWSVAQINADDVWSNTGLTGNGVVVAVLDTGMDLNHPDLVNRLWINTAEDINGDGMFTAVDNNLVDDDGNGYIDDVVGWDFGNNDNNPDDFHGHGTHVSGSVAGDGAGGTATGVAPGSRIMVLSYSATIVAGQTEAWLGMQYALDNGADIVNFSSAWYDSWSPDYQTWRNNVDVLADAGLLFVAAAGNDNPHDPAPGDVLTPARAPRALALGATDNTDTIASFSGLGPTSWEGVTGYDDYIHPPGLLKPDVVAPGESVESTNNGGGYVNGPVWSGTSMAAPHAAGTAALLLEEDPALLPHELMYIIRETAVDLGAVGEDNVYGYGRIDALAGVSYAYSHTPVYDLSVTGTNHVWTTVDIWVDNNDDGIPDDPVANTNNHLYARIRNIGGQAVGNVEIKFYYADVGTVGISGFDPNGDGDPADGNFNYIDSYFVPVVGPSGSSQDTAVGVVNWNVPVPITDHWCVGIGIVAPDPPNAAEINTSNNAAFRNFFSIIVTFSQTLAFPFFVYPDPRQPLEPFDLEIVRYGLLEEFEVELAVDRRLAKQWFHEVPGFKPVKRIELKNFPEVDEYFLKRGERVEAYVRLVAKRGALRKIETPKGKPVLVYLLIRAPSRRVTERMKWLPGEQLLVINAVNGKGIFGGLALNIRFDRQGKMRDKRQLFHIRVEDAVEAELIKQQLGLEPEQIQQGLFYYYGNEQLNEQLREFGYQPEAVNPDEVFGHLAIIKGIGIEEESALREAGVRMLLREKTHLVVYATPAQLRRLARAGYIIEDIRRGEPRPRQIRIYLGKREDLAEVAPYLSDYYNIEADPRSTGYVVYCAAWDDMIDELRERGYTVKPGPNGGN